MRLASGTAAVLVGSWMLVGCSSDVAAGDVVGVWESTSSDAVIEIHADGRFEAQDYPQGLDTPGDCTWDNIERDSWSGWVDDSTLESGFLYANGHQWWVDDVRFRGLGLSVIVCGETLIERFERSD